MLVGLLLLVGFCSDTPLSGKINADQRPRATSPPKKCFQWVGECIHAYVCQTDIEQTCAIETCKAVVAWKYLKAGF